MVMENVVQLNLWSAFVGLAGGLALLLYGMDLMSQGFKGAAGDNLRLWLGKVTGNRFAAVGTGLVVTAMVQSSSVTTVLLVGFISAGLMTLEQSLGVIIGADIGSTITAQIVAFNINEAALFLVAAGFSIWFPSRSDRMRHIGSIIMGMGFVFYGMAVMVAAMHPLQAYPPFIDFMMRMKSTGVAIVFGAAFTAIIHSSAATMGVVIALASRGLIDLETGIALSFGANIGTCVTAILAAIGKSRDAWRAAIAHVGFKIVGVLIWVGFIGVLAKVVLFVSPTEGGPDAVLPRQIANAHTLFNVLNMFIFIWLVKPAARFLKWLVPERKEGGRVLSMPQFISDDLLQAPSLALAAARREIERLGKIVSGMVDDAMPVILHGDNMALDRLAARDADVDSLYETIIDYLRRVGRSELNGEQGQLLMRLMEVAGDLESIGDVVELDLVPVGRHRIAEKVEVSPQTEEIISGVARRVCEAMGLALAAVGQGDERAVQTLLAMKGEMAHLGEAAREHGVRRLMSDDPNRFRTYSREMEVIERLRRVYYFARKVGQVSMGMGETATD